MTQPLPGPSGKQVGIRFSNPNVSRLGQHIASAARRGLPVAKHNMHAGVPGAVVVGLGSSLKEPGVLREIRRRVKDGWLVFGIKESIGWLLQRGVKVDYGVNMDPGAQEAQRVPVFKGVTYCLASSCHPDLYEHVLGHGGAVLVYHSACGWPNETLCYRELFGRGDVVIGGFTVANRAIGLHNFMGIAKTFLVGCDFGWRDGGQYYSDIVKAAPLRDIVMQDHAATDGRTWHSRPDLLASAVTVARMIKAGQVETMGDSLALSLSRREDEFLNKIAAVKKQDGSVVPL